MPILQIGDTHRYTREQKYFLFNVEWTSRQFGIICDLDLTIYCYDERARFIEKLDTGSKRTRDGACVLLSDQDSATGNSNTFSENVKIDTRLVNNETTAILLYLDGGPRNFQFVQVCVYVHVRSIRGYTSRWLGYEWTESGFCKALVLLYHLAHSQCHTT